MESIRTRRSTGELVMPLAVFRQLDYGLLCQKLGLSPSRPSKSAAQLAKRKPRS